jgi:hypothetical protein
MTWGHRAFCILRMQYMWKIYKILNHATQAGKIPITSRQVSLDFMSVKNKKMFKNEVCDELWRKKT